MRLRYWIITGVCQTGERVYSQGAGYWTENDKLAVKFRTEADADISIDWLKRNGLDWPASGLSQIVAVQRSLDL